MNKQLQRVLIANRSEIAVRIIHACHDQGRTAIAIYADDDADSLFVQLADESYALQGRSPRETYLDIGKIIAIARRCHADAVHPGYGFLSENADFAQAVSDAGMAWIGPSPQTIRALGDKVEARRIAAAVGAPMVPGTTTPVRDAGEIADFARRFGFPVAIKAVHGGGGRGMKVVRRIEDIEEALLSASHEAQVAFGNGDCFIERFLDHPRHVEVQVLGDTYGHVLAIGTRDCSLQRRNQKLIEEAPAPFLDVSVAQRLKDAAVAICERTGYISAGTVEFLVDDDGSASFMEVNTRIQVEHPVTEAVTGIDLVAQQLRIAQGGSIADLDVHTHGHAIEMRINAEDPAHGFVPYPGVIKTLRTPSGPGIRFDTGIAVGSRVSDQFDSMLAKLVVHADTRAECLARARRALRELRIEGVPTVVTFDRVVLENSDFTAEQRFGVYTRWIEEKLLPDIDMERLDEQSYGPRAADVIVSRAWIEIDGRRVQVGLPAGCMVNGGQAGFARLNDRAAGGTYSADSGEGDADSVERSPQDAAVKATISGTLVRWLVEDGRLARADEPIAVLEAMKMETQITAPCAGVLHHVRRVGEQIVIAQRIATIDVDSTH